jgi:hypothetical protein
MVLIVITLRISILRVIMLTISMPSVLMLYVILTRVAAPSLQLLFTFCLTSDSEAFLMLVSSSVTSHPFPRKIRRIWI